jgi:hypothetical protein
MPRPRKSTDQLPLDFDAADRLRRERYQLIDAVSDQRLGQKNTRCWQLRCLLKAVHYYDHGEGCFAGDQTILDTMQRQWNCRISRRTLSTVRQLATQLGLLLVTPRPLERGRGRSTDLLRVDWMTLAAIDESHRPHESRRGAESCRATKMQLLSTNVQVASTKMQGLHHPYKEDHSLGTLLKNTPPQPPAGDRHRDEWQVVVEEIFECGVNQARRAVDQARHRGTTMADIRRIIAYWRRHRDAWRAPEYALYVRLCRGLPPGSPIGEGWLPRERDYAERRSREAKRLRDQRRSASREVAAAELARRWNALEAPCRERIKRGLLAEFRYLHAKPRLLPSLLVDLCGRDDLRGPLAELLAPLRRAKSPAGGCDG